ncbi:phenylalanine--tRNA ligase beta subunit [Peptococcaceae bacterium CEB3]|nr:phenylalanine--tRNA ligase beta subunit [Peptococcaceae bacterium CEB3]
MPQIATTAPESLLTAVGVVVGRVIATRLHPNAERIRIADVVYAPGGEPSQIIFGGLVDVVKVGSYVPVVPPTKSCRVEGVKMRRRKFRGVVSRGELCSLYELGLSSVDTDQVAVLSCKPELGLPIAELVKNARTYRELWDVFERAAGFNESDLQILILLAGDIPGS